MDGPSASSLIGKGDRKQWLGVDYRCQGETIGREPALVDDAKLDTGAALRRPAEHAIRLRQPAT